MPLTSQDFEFVCKFIRDQSGIILEHGKEYLVESRLGLLAQREGMSGIEELLNHLRKDSTVNLKQKIMEAMTTNETSFFRDFAPFEALKSEIFPKLMESRKAEKRLNMWCGACSSGQEPYSVLMLLGEYFPSLMDWNLQFVASDISRQMLDRTREGKFGQLEVNRGMPAAMLVKYFKKAAADWQIRDDLRKKLSLVEINLIRDWPILPVFDIIFLRNVLIYFDVEAKKSIFAKLRRHLKPDGYLFLGAAETTFGLDDNFERISIKGVSVYRVKSANVLPKAA